MRDPHTESAQASGEAHVSATLPLPLSRPERAAARPAPRLLRRLLHCVLFYVVLIHLGAMSLTWNFACLLVHPFLPAAHGLVVGRAAISWCYRNLWTFAQRLGLMQIDYAALDALSLDGGLIIAANHPSILDALLIIARVPRGICIMRASLMRNPFLGAGARLARYILNDPPRGMIRSAVANLKAGGQLVYFPEGTRTVRAPVNEFRPGITLIAQLAQVPIQTVIIETESPYLSKGWPIWRTPEFPIRIRVRLGQRFAPEADHQGFLKRLEAYFAGELS